MTKGTLGICSGTQKTKSKMKLPPVAIPNFTPETGLDNALMESFLQAATADEQLNILKTILDKEKESVDRTVVKLLMLVFFHSEAKHPVKCFLARHISKSKHLQEPFIEELTSEISEQMKNSSSYELDVLKYYKDVVPKVYMCIENFTPGTTAVKNVDKELAKYLANCLYCCIRDIYSNHLSPTEKNQIYGLVHITLRLLLHVITKMQPTEEHACLVNWIKHSYNMNGVIHDLLMDKELPMDIKCLCGIVLLAFEAYSCSYYDSGYWKIFVYPSGDNVLHITSRDDHVRLAMCSAVVSTVPPAQLGAAPRGTEPAAVTALLETLLHLGDRSSSDAAVCLGVARALHHIAKGLGSLPRDLGVQTMREVCTFVWGHLEHYMDSVRHIAAQMLTCIVHYCACLEAHDEGAALRGVVCALRARGGERRGYCAGLRGAARGLGAARVLRDVAPLAPLLRALRDPLHATAVTTTLDELLRMHSREAGPVGVYREWVVPVFDFVQGEDLEAEVLVVLERLLATAAALNAGLAALILPHVKQACESPDHNLKNLLVLVSVARSSIADQLEQKPREQNVHQNSDEQKSAEQNVDQYLDEHNSGAHEFDEHKSGERNIDRNSDEQKSGEQKVYQYSDEHNSGTPEFVKHKSSEQNIDRNSDEQKSGEQNVDQYSDEHNSGAHEFDEHKSGERNVDRNSDEHNSDEQKSGEHNVDETKPGERWRGIISYDILNDAVVDANDEIRLHALSLMCGGRGELSPGECAVARRFLRYNINAQAPHFRQRALALLKKFIKRVEDGYRAAKRKGNSSNEQRCRCFLAATWRQCFDSLLPQANYSRRCVALTLLQLLAHPTDRVWSEEYVDKLLIALDDSYETNKAMSLSILQHCPIALLQDKKYSVSLDLEDIIRQASALKPTECVSAAYKLQLLLSRLAENVLRGRHCEAKEPAVFTVLSELLGAGRRAGRSPAAGAPRDTANYGLLHCMCHLLTALSPQAIVDDCKWKTLIQEILHWCWGVICDSEGVVCAAAPEGAAPPHALYEHYGNNAGLQLEDDGLVTPQMVLLVAWRSVKEACMVMGTIGSRLQVWGTLSPRQLDELEQRLARVVTSARHRGAFEQAYQAYELLLHRMWRDPEVQHNAAYRLRITLEWLRKPSPFSKPADRRSAGLPFFIQAIVSTEPSGAALRDVMAALLARAREPSSRAHACNILRALYRASSLDTAVQSYVGEGLCVALEGFDGNTWEERNSSTLLLSALVTRVFGVARCRESLSARNRMTGRVFFTRHPRLYDVMLNKLKAVSESETKLLCPSLFPVLTLLGRLYPSALEGTESNFKLVSFIPWVVRCARSPVLKARRLAAAAGVSLVPPHSYIGHLEYLFSLISDPKVERNFCHGILLQICALLEEPPAGLDASPLRRAVRDTAWVYEQSCGARPCYPLLHQHVLTVRALLQQYPEILEPELLVEIKKHLSEIVFARAAPAVAPGRQVCLQDCLRLLLALCQTGPLTGDKGQLTIPDLIIRALAHDAYEVSDAALDYMLSLYTSSAACDVSALVGVRARSHYLPAVCAPLDNYNPMMSLFGWTRPDRVLERILQVLVAEGSAQRLLLSRLETGQCGFRYDNRMNDVQVAGGLVRCVAHLPVGVQPLGLELVSELLAGQEPLPNDYSDICQIVRHTRWMSLPRAETEARAAAARLLQRCAARLMAHAALSTGHPPLTEEVEANVLCALCVLLDDEEPHVRALAAAAVDTLRPRPAPPAAHQLQAVVPSLGRERLLAACAARRGAPALLTALALQDTAPAADGGGGAARELRVFDESEKANVHLEETVIARECGALVAAARGPGAEACVRGALRSRPLGEIVARHGDAFLQLADGGDVAADPKVALFLRALRGL